MAWFLSHVKKANFFRTQVIQLKCQPHVLVGLSCVVRPLSSTESCSLVRRGQGQPARPAHQGEGSRLGGGALHRAVLSVSLSMSSRTWPGRSLLPESECISGKTLCGGSDTLELASGQKQRCGVSARSRPRGQRGRSERREAGKSQLMRTHDPFPEAPQP